jgi:hypothetical protein
MKGFELHHILPKSMGGLDIESKIDGLKYTIVEAHKKFNVNLSSLKSCVSSGKTKFKNIKFEVLNG